MRAATDRVSRWLYPRQWGLVALFFALYELTAENSFGLLEVQPCSPPCWAGDGKFCTRGKGNISVSIRKMCASRRTAIGLGVESGRRVPGVGRGDVADFPAGRRMVGRVQRRLRWALLLSLLLLAPLEGGCGQ